jgi:hypothetical protein
MQMVTDEGVRYQQRAIFYIENEDYYVISIAKREEVYQLWE